VSVAEGKKCSFMRGASHVPPTFNYRPFAATPGK
jgi:hypothetical protein